MSRVLDLTVTCHHCPQRKQEKQVFNVEDSHDTSTPRAVASMSSACSPSSSSPGTSSKPVSHTPPPPKAPTPSLAKCPSSRQSPCYHSPSLRSQPPNPLTPTPSPAAAAPRSPALSPAPSHLSKGLERAGDRAEGQPPQDYPQSLEPGERRGKVSAFRLRASIQYVTLLENERLEQSLNGHKSHNKSAFRLHGVLLNLFGILEKESDLKKIFFRQCEQSKKESQQRVEIW